MSYIRENLDTRKASKISHKDGATCLTPKGAFNQVTASLTVFCYFHCFTPSWILPMGNSSFTHVINLDDVIIMFLLLSRVDTLVKWPMWHVMNQFDRVSDESL